MKKIKIIALFGKSGAGKDTIQKWMVSNVKLTHGIISCTTRPKRDYEQHGIDYFFISNEEFTKKICNNTMLEATTFNNWSYGTPLEGLNPHQINIGVFNITGIKTLLTKENLDVLPVYVQAPDKIRLERNLHRELYPNCHEICRRFLADEKDFEVIPFAYVTYDNSNELNCDLLYYGPEEIALFYDSLARQVNNV